MKKIIITLVIIAILGFMIATNPTIDDYSSFTKNEIIDNAKDEDKLTRGFAVLFSGVKSSVITSATTRSNYVFFSLYKTDLPTVKISCIGIFGNFINCVNESK